MSLYRLSITISALFHAALATALAYQASALREPQLVAGRDSVQSITMRAVASRAEPRQLDAPVIVTPTEVRIDQRRFVETTKVSVTRQPSETTEAETAASPQASAAVSPQATLPAPPPPKVQRTVVRESDMPTRDTPTDAPEPPEPVQRAARQPQPSVNMAASAAVAKELGADTQQHRQPVVTPPVFTSARPPVFPTEAERHGWTGIVMLMITVDARGAVTRVEVLESSGYAALDAAAVRAVRSWRGRPAMRNGTPFESKWKKPIRFE